LRLCLADNLFLQHAGRRRRPEIEGKVFTAVTGIPASELPVYAERIFNMQRLIRVREGHRIPEDDFPPDFNFTEPLFVGMHGYKMIMPGPGAQPVDLTGNKLDINKFTAMLKEYYKLRGWIEIPECPPKRPWKSWGYKRGKGVSKYISPDEYWVEVRNTLSKNNTRTQKNSWMKPSRPTQVSVGFNHFVLWSTGYCNNMKKQHLKYRSS